MQPHAFRGIGSYCGLTIPGTESTYGNPKACEVRSRNSELACVRLQAYCWQACKEACRQQRQQRKLRQETETEGKWQAEARPRVPR